jgi:DNA uptake protein ComE-like DNA-binding protein
LPHYVAQRLIKYRDIIGGFKAKTQIRRTYGLADSVYSRLAPYIQLPDELPARAAFAATKSRYPERPSTFAVSKFPRKPTHLAPFDLNAADTTQFMQIRGIGRGLSSRIVAYRARLGGFSRKDQLSEIYNLPPDLVDSLRKYTFVGAGFAPTLIDVNNATLAELKDHPYVGLRLGRVLIAYRQQHGPYQQATDLRKIRILDDLTFEKLQPYLRF